MRLRRTMLAGSVLLLGPACGEEPRDPELTYRCVDEIPLAGSSCAVEDEVACTANIPGAVCRDGRWERDEPLDECPRSCPIPGFVGLDRAERHRVRGRRVRYPPVVSA